MANKFGAISAASLIVISGAIYAGCTTSTATASKVHSNSSTAGCRAQHGTCAPSLTTTTTSPTPTATTTLPSGHKVMVIIEENHSRAEAMAGMPHLATWASRYGQATYYRAATHPSLPNYLAIAGGSTFGISDDLDPSVHPISGASVFGQTLAAGETAKAYAESMPSNCDQTGSGEYAVRHNEWTYFSSAKERKACKAYDVPMGTTTGGNLLHDINKGLLPITGQMTPNLCNDAHDCSLSVADSWLKGWVNLLMAGPDYKHGRLTIVITFDEDDHSASNSVAFVVIDPRLSGKKVTLAANHYSLTRWLDANAGTAYLRKASTAARLKSAFGL